MKKLFLLIIFIIGTLQPAAYAQSFDEIVQKFEDKKGAEVLKVPGVLMKMALALADEDEDMPREAMEFLRHITSMTILDLSDCNDADKLAFATAMKSLTIDDFETIDTGDVETARVFFHKGKKKNQMIPIIATSLIAVWAFPAVSKPYFFCVLMFLASAKIRSTVATAATTSGKGIIYDSETKAFYFLTSDAVATFTFKDGGTQKTATLADGTWSFN